VERERGANEEKNGKKEVFLAGNRSHGPEWGSRHGETGMRAVERWEAVGSYLANSRTGVQMSGEDEGQDNRGGHGGDYQGTKRFTGYSAYAIIGPRGGDSAKGGQSTKIQFVGRKGEKPNIKKKRQGSTPSHQCPRRGGARD